MNALKQISKSKGCCGVLGDSGDLLSSTNPHRNGLKLIIMSWSGYIMPRFNQEFEAGL